MPPPKNALTVTALERMLARKRAQLDRLKRRRTLLRRQLEKVERQISQISGPAGSELKPKKTRQRPQNAQPLTKVVVDVLRKNKGGLPLAMLAEKIRATGYKSHSTDFKNVLYQCLYNQRDTVVRDEQRGLYKLK